MVKFVHFCLDFPDKNPSSDALVKFREIATAHSVLKDDNSRAAYHYYLDHPDEVWVNTASYYRATYGPKNDVRLVLGGFVALTTLVQYLVQKQRYKQVLDHRFLRKSARLFHVLPGDQLFKAYQGGT